MAICISLTFPILLQVYIVLQYRKKLSELEQKVDHLTKTQEEAFSAACKRYDDIIEHKDNVVCFLKERLADIGS
tara:strand:+ start:2013 stop:2234 length:222 start_codon:yes stop_codon:yes gene_type:complete